MSKPRHHTKEFVLKKLVGDLGRITSGTDGESSKKEDGGITTTIKQLHATQKLYENSSRLGTCQVLMDGLDERLKEREEKLPASSAKELNKERRMLREIIAPMLTDTKVNTEAAAANLSPIAAVKRGALEWSRGRDCFVQLLHLFPSECSSRADKRGRKGYFEDLLAVFGAGFDPSCSIAESVCRCEGRWCINSQ